MMSRPKRGLEVISISALDLFASALGVFILMSVLLFPYYLKQPSTEQDLLGAQAAMSDAGAAMDSAKQIANDSEDEMAEAEALRSKAIDELQEAEASLSEADRIKAIAARLAKESEQKKKAKEEQDARINITDVDLVFVMDATGSMGREIRDVQDNLLSIVRIVHRLAPSLNVGFVAFKDRGDEYLTRTFQLTPMTDGNLRRLQSFVRRLRAGGGGDTPEPVGVALNSAISMNWRSTALGWIVVVGDAPAHKRAWSNIFNVAERFNRRRTTPDVQRRISTIFTGKRRTGRRAKQFFERLALRGGGDFVPHNGRMVESVLLSILR